MASPFFKAPKGDGPYMLEFDTAGDLAGLIAAFNNVTSSPEGSLTFQFSPSNLVVKLNPNLLGQGTGQDVVLIAIDDEGNVSAKQGQVIIKGELTDYSP